MKKYNRKRVELLRQQQQQQRVQGGNNNDSTTGGGDEIDSLQDQLDLANEQQLLNDQSSSPINSRSFPPPKPLWVFDLSKGKTVNSRLPMTLKLVSTKTDVCYLQFRDKQSYAMWCNACTKNLHIELTEQWRVESRAMIASMQHQQNINRLQQSTPVKKRPVLTTSARA